MVIALFAALIVPWFVNWNDYRASFEAEASRILGHRVHVEGDARATILPSPSLTFTNVEVDDQDGGRIMDVARFDVVIELMPLLQGEIRVISMTLEKPVVNVAIDAAGNVPWLSRIKLREPFDPDKVVLDNIAIKDGQLNYSDARTGVTLAFDGISAQVTARALLGPWHVDGFYLDGGNQVGFRISTGRVLDNGTLRVKADVNPARWPVTVGVDGSIGIDPAGGPAWSGTYSVTQVAADDSGDNGGADGPTGWRSEGAFTLTGNKLDISKAVLSNGPLDRPLSVAGALAINFGRSPSFTATAEARQIDLDRTLGKGPSQPVDVSAATDSLVAWLSQLPVPEIPGRISLDLPTIVVGGRIIQDVSLTAAPAEGGWQIGSLSARLPGQATLEASGLVTTLKKFGFDGQARLAVMQPATFATWWRGRSQEGTGRLLAPFDLSGHAEIGPNLVAFDHVTAQIDSATITGKFNWGEVGRDHRRSLGAVLDAKGRIDFVQVKALAELLVGHNLTNAGALADSYSLQISADAFAYQDLSVRGIQVNAKYGDDALEITKLQVDDIAGARIAKTFGEIDNLSGDPHGHLDVMVDAPKLTGLARLAGRFLPQSGFTHWLAAAAPALGEAVMNAKITAPLPDGGAGFAFTIENGVAASTAFNLSASFTGGFAHWRSKPAEIKATLDSPDSAGLARQFGLAAVALDKDNGAHVEVQAKGVPGDGLDTVVVADLAGLIANASGKLTIAETLAPAFEGKIGVSADSIGPIAVMAGLDIPGTSAGAALAIDGGRLSVSGSSLALAWENGKIGPAIAGGNLTLAPDGNSWRVDGKLTVDEADLGWIASLGLGLAPVPTGDPAAPWSREPFTGPAFGQLSGQVQVAADRLDVGDLHLTSAAFALALQPQRIDVDLSAGQLDGGTVTGAMRVHNVGGNVNFLGQFDLKGAALELLVWRRDGRSVATGTLDLSAKFELTGHSAAGLVSTMTGGGALTVHDGLARYVNPNTVRLIVRASDLGQQYSEDALRAAFSERIDADNLTFKDASSAFAIVAGAVRLKNLIVESKGLTARGNAVVDFNAMTLDSDWNLAFQPVDNKVQGSDPEAGIVFQGPLASPARSIDVLPFAAYLNEREAARMNEIIALDAASRAEKERLSRLADKLKQDAAQRIEDARIAAEREAARHAAAQAQAIVLEAFHVNREILVKKRHIEALAALAGRLVAEQKRAQANADQAAQAAAEAQSKADDAAKALAGARQADKAAADKAVAAASDLAGAKAKADSAAHDAAQAADAADRAKQALAAATAAETNAKSAADAAAQAKADADAGLKAAVKQVATATNAADKASAAADSTAANKADADKAVATATKERDAAQAVFADAEAAVQAAQAAADTAASQATTAGGGESEAEAAKTAADQAASAATAALAQATSVRDAAGAKLDAAKQAAATAQKVADDKAAQAKQAADLAKAVAVGDGADGQAIATAEAMQSAADGVARQAVDKKAAADTAKAVVADAQAVFDEAQRRVADAETRSQAATAAATKADAAVKNAAAGARSAAAKKAAALTGLDEKTKTRDAAKATLAAKEAVVEKATADAAAAAKAAVGAAAAADNAKADLQVALAAKAAAEQALAERSAKADDTAKAAQDATAKRQAATTDAKAATAAADKVAKASAAAAKVLADASSANDAAAAAAKAAAADHQAAEATAALTAARAKTAEASAQSAAADAVDATAAADAAQQTAEQAAQAAPDVGPIAIPVPASSGQGASPAPTATAAPVKGASAPAPQPKSVPLPKILPTDGPLIITPPTYH